MTLDEIKVQNPGHEILEINAEEFPEPLYFRVPNRFEVARLRTELEDKNNQAGKNFIFGCLLHPGKEVLDRLLNKLPAVDTGIVDKLYEASGGKIRLEVKKA